MRKIDKLHNLYLWGKNNSADMQCSSFKEFRKLLLIFFATETGGIAYTRDPFNPSICWAHAYEEKGMIGLKAYRKTIEIVCQLGVTAILVACVNPKVQSLCKRLNFAYLEGRNPEIYIYNNPEVKDE